MANKDAPVAVSIIGGLVNITLGVSTLCNGIKDAPVFCEDEPEITDEYAFVRAVCERLTAADQDGLTPVHQMLDAAVARAVADGVDGIRLKGGA